MGTDAARTGFKGYECQAVVAAIAGIVAEEVREGNRITLSDESVETGSNSGSTGGGSDDNPDGLE